MNTTIVPQTSSTEISFDEQFLRDLADVELVLIGGGDIAGTGQ
jgi:hypothetical protein